MKIFAATIKHQSCAKFMHGTNSYLADTWETTHVREVVGSNPGTKYWMDMTFFTFICSKNCIVCFEKTENKRKRGWGLAHFIKS